MTYESSWNVPDEPLVIKGLMNYQILVNSSCNVLMMPQVSWFWFGVGSLISFFSSTVRNVRSPECISCLPESNADWFSWGWDWGAQGTYIYLHINLPDALNCAGLPCFRPCSGTLDYFCMFLWITGLWQECYGSLRY